MSDEIKKSGDMPVTQKNLNETRKELKSDIATVRLEMKEGFNKIDAKFNKVDAKFDELGAKIENLTAVAHRTLAIVEEQNTKNNYVLDGHSSLQNQFNEQQKLNNERFDQIESSIKAVKKLDH